MNNSEDVFLKQMSGVKPLKKNHRVKKEFLKKKYMVVRKKTEKQTTNNTNNNKDSKKNSEYSLEKIDLKKGIKKGFFKINRKIDFHGRTLIESEEKFTNSVIESYSFGERCLLFVTGKGLFKSKNIEESEKPKLYNSVIRSSFIEWVSSNKLSKYILSYEKASADHGGDGAFYVYLRKKKN